MTRTELVKIIDELEQITKNFHRQTDYLMIAMGLFHILIGITTLWFGHSVWVGWVIAFTCFFIGILIIRFAIIDLKNLTLR